MLTTGVLICCTCHLQNDSLLFILASSVCKSLQYLTSTLTHGGEGGHLFRLPCSVVLWDRGVLQTNITGVCGECSQCLGHTGFAPAHGKLQVALQGNCLKQALGCMQFPGLSHSGSGSRVFHKCTDSVGLVFCAVSRSKKLK